MSDKTQNLVKKILKVMKAVGAVGKGGFNSHQNYKYLAHADLMKALHPELIKEGLLMYPAETTVIRTQTVPGKNSKGYDINTQITVIQVNYVITDGLETLVFTGIGEGVDNGDKASYKAQTGAHKYALKGLLTLPDELDAEADEVKIGPPPLPKAKSTVETAGPKEVQELTKLEAIIAGDKQACFKKYKINKWDDLPKTVAVNMISYYSQLLED